MTLDLMIEKLQEAAKKYGGNLPVYLSEGEEVHFIEPVFYERPKEPYFPPLAEDVAGIQLS